MAGWRIICSTVPHLCSYPQKRRSRGRMLHWRVSKDRKYRWKKTEANASVGVRRTTILTQDDERGLLLGSRCAEISWREQWARNAKLFMSELRIELTVLLRGFEVTTAKKLQRSRASNSCDFTFGAISLASAGYPRCAFFGLHRQERQRRPLLSKKAGSYAYLTRSNVWMTNYTSTASISRVHPLSPSAPGRELAVQVQRILLRDTYTEKGLEHGVYKIRLRQRKGWRGARERELVEGGGEARRGGGAVSYTHLRAHETDSYL
eukprot:735569-Pleurochrysis_carterae.AAC.2